MGSHSSNTDGHPSDENEVEPLNVLDLPQIYQKPSAEVLLSALVELSLQPLSWDTSSGPVLQRRRVKSEGVASYLTKIISSSLEWIEDDSEKEQIWETAAERLSERSGRTAMGAITRTFGIPLTAVTSESGRMEDDDSSATITLYEPTLTGDNLGLKTWASSFLLAKRLATLKSALFPDLPHDAQILELGAGTGLVGLAAAAIFQRSVILTDLPDIVPNITHNIEINKDLLRERNAQAQSAVLDWSNPTSLHVQDRKIPPHSFPLILAADPVYDPEQPALFAQAVDAHLARHRDARVLVEMPLREGFEAIVTAFVGEMEGSGLRKVEGGEGEEVGLDDWGDGDREVRCWWSVWCWGPGIETVAAAGADDVST